jgi:hypothetical protein
MKQLKEPFYDLYHMSSFEISRLKLSRIFHVFQRLLSKLRLGCFNQLIFTDWLVNLICITASHFMELHIDVMLCHL